MKIFKLDKNFKFKLPLSLADMVNITDIYRRNLKKRELMYAIINMVNETQDKCEVLSWGYNGVGINGKYYNYKDYFVFDNYLFEVKTEDDIKLAARYFKLLMIKKLL